MIKSFEFGAGAGAHVIDEKINTWIKENNAEVKHVNVANVIHHNRSYLHYVLLYENINGGEG